MKFRPQNISIVEWIAILPKIAALVADVVTALKDGRVTTAEAEKIGADFIAAVAVVV